MFAPTSPSSHQIGELELLEPLARDIRQCSIGIRKLRAEPDDWRVIEEGERLENLLGLAFVARQVSITEAALVLFGYALLGTRECTSPRRAVSRVHWG